MQDLLPYSPVGTLHVLPPELRFMIYALTLKPRTLDFEIEGRGAQLRVCPRTALAFSYLPVIAHVCAEMRTYVFGRDDGECCYTPITMEYHILAASLGPDGFDVVERLVTSPAIAAAGVAPDDLSIPVAAGSDSMESYGNPSESESESDEENMVFFDDYLDSKARSKASLPGSAKDTPSSGAISVTRGCITCFAGSSRRTIRGVFSPKIDHLVLRPVRLSRLNIVFNPVAPDLVYIENAPPIRLLSHRRTPYRSAFTRYLQAEADEFVAKHDNEALAVANDSTSRDDVDHDENASPELMGHANNGTDTREARTTSLIEDQRITSGRYEIITVPDEVSILREIPWVHLPRGRFHSLRRW